MTNDDITTCLIAMMVGTLVACIILLSYWEVKDR